MPEIIHPQQTFESEPIEHLSMLQNGTLRRGLALAAAVFALVGAEKPATVDAASLPAQTINNLYTPLSPDAIISTMQNDLVPNQGLVIKSAILSPSTLNAQGDCEKGSMYSSWLDTLDSLQQAKCDGSPSVTTAHENPSSLQLRYQNELQAFGSQIINSIPGQSIDLKQKVKTLEASQDLVQEDFTCPRPSARQPYPNIQTVKIAQGNNASLAFCPSNKRVSISPVDINNAKFKSAFTEFKTDPLRNTQWGGDQYKHNLYVMCPNVPFTYLPNLKSEYSTKNKMITAVFKGLSPIEYCDEVGQFTSEVSAQIKKVHSRTYKKIGQSALHVDGLREILVYGSSVQFPNRDITVHTSLPGTKIACGQNLRDAKVRVKLVERFKGMRSQQFAHAPDGTTTDMPNRAKTYYTRAYKVCP